MIDAIDQPKDLITFVCCIEYGRLEKQTILMVETLRANAGEFSKCRVIAVVGRFGPKLTKTTLEELNRLNVELVYAEQENPVSWFHYANKIVAVTVAQRIATTPTVAWLDSDLLFVRPPYGLLLKDTEDITTSLDYLPPAIVQDEGMLHLPYWRGLCDLLEVKFEDIPVLYNEVNGKNQYAYFSSGVFVWRRKTTFIKVYRESFIALISSKLAQFNGTFFTADQVILSPIIVREDLRWRHLAYQDHHVTVHGQIEGVSASPNMDKSNLLHYSQSLTHPHREKYLVRLKNECPRIIQFIEANDALDISRNWFAELHNKFLKVYRGIRWRLFAIKLVRTPKGESVAVKVD